MNLMKRISTGVNISSRDFVKTNVSPHIATVIAAANIPLSIYAYLCLSIRSGDDRYKLLKELIDDYHLIFPER